MKYQGLLTSSKILLDKQKKRLLYYVTILISILSLSHLSSQLANISNSIIYQSIKLLAKTFIILLFAIIFLTLINYLTISSNSIQNNQNIIYSTFTNDSQTFNTENYSKNDITFYEFKIKYNKLYTTNNQQIFRSIIFQKNKHKILSHNQLNNKTFIMEINQFADLTPQQFASIYTTLYQSNTQIKHLAQEIVSPKILANQIQTDKNYFIAQRIRQSATDEVKKQILQKYENSMRENPQFVYLTEILSHKKNYNFVDRIYKNQGLKQSLSSSATNLTLSNGTSFANDGNFTLDVIDWTVYSGQIRYQGICGACYTFATSDVVASLYSIYKFGFFIPLSTQQVIDCSTNGLTYGCNGGFLEGSYVYMQIRGIQPDSVYPYTSSVDDTSKQCKVTGGPFKVASFRNIDEGDCKNLVNQLSYGPVSIGIAGYRLQFYSDGIFNDCNSYIDHAVVLIGYKAGVGWKIKNSWGTEWGMQGFAWIQDGDNCGICSMAVSAKIQ